VSRVENHRRREENCDAGDVIRLSEGTSGVSRIIAFSRSLPWRAVRAFDLDAARRQ
jgi:hypothetical protein